MLTISNLLSRVRRRFLLYVFKARCILPVDEVSTFSLIDGSRFDYPLKTAIGCALFCGGFETVEAKFLLNLLKPGDIFLDVGANAGFFTVIAAKQVGITGHVYAFEPGQRELKLLHHNIAINHLTNVTVIESAVSNKNGTAKFAISEDGAMNSMAKNNHPLQQIEEWCSVPTVSIDKFAEDYKVNKVDCIKIDVEGAEKLVFEGLKNVLFSNEKLLIIFEASDLNTIGFAYSVKDLLEELMNLGINLYSNSRTS